MNANSTLDPSNALASINARLFYFAKISPSSVLTALKCFKSYLLPTIITTMSLSAFSFISFNHFSKLSKVGDLVISYTNNAPIAPL